MLCHLGKVRFVVWNDLLSIVANQGFSDSWLKWSTPMDDDGGLSMRSRRTTVDCVGHEWEELLPCDTQDLRRSAQNQTRLWSSPNPEAATGRLAVPAVWLSAALATAFWGALPTWHTGIRRRCAKGLESMPDTWNRAL